MRRRTSALVAAAMIAALLPVSTATATAQEQDDGEVVISALRTRGPSGATDEYIELHNIGGSPVDISGWVLQGCAAGSGNTSNRATVGPGTVVPAGGYFLFTNTGYSGTAGDATYGTGIADDQQSGVRIVDAASQAVSGVGTSASPCREGAGIGTAFPGSAPFDFLRADDRTRNTGNNAVDFEGSPTSGVTPRSSANNPDVPQPIIATCPDFAIVEGQSGFTGVSATDADSAVVSAEITSGDAAFMLDDPVPATGPGGTYTASIVVPNTLAADSYDVTVTFTNDDAEPQTANCTLTVTVQGDVCEVPDEDLTPINEIQGSGSSTPISGEQVVTRGVVTTAFPSGGATDLPNNHGLRGFFIEAVAEDRDDDPQTSEGLFVFDFDGVYASDIGDLVYVEGTAGEGFEVTQVSSNNFRTCTDVEVDTELPPPAELPLPTAPEDRAEVMEPLESMRVTHDELTLVEFFQLERFGEVRLSSGGVLANPTNIVDPYDDAAYNTVVEFNAANNIILASGRTAQNINRPGPEGTPPLPFLEPGDTLRIGDQLIDETFVLHYAFNSWRLQPIDIDELSEEFQQNRTRPRPLSPPDVGGTMTVASFNVLNYFDGDGQGGGFPTERGALTPSELERQTEKLVAAVTKIDADVVGLIEIENDGGEFQATRTFVDALNAEYGEEVYDFIDTGVIGTDAIKQAFIYKPSTVEATGDYAILDSSVDPRFDDQRSRPALAQTFTELATGEAVTVTVNHLKSKGSACDPDDNDPRQGNCNGVRERAAEAIADWLATDPTDEDSAGHLIIGDINAYAKEDPIVALQEAGYTDLLEKFSDGEMPYTYTFDATQGYLDHALADEELLPSVTGAAAWNINADEVPSIDYLEGPGNFRTNEVGEQYYQSNEFRSSDHDPVLVGLQLGEAPANTPPTVQDLSLATDQDTPVDGQLIIGDEDGDELTVQYGTPTSGTVTGNDAGAFTYTPAAGYSGTATFQVTVSDGTDQATATVTVTVRPVDDGDTFVECPPGTGSGFPDVPASSVHANAIRCGNALEILQGKVGGLFDPAGSLTRGQVATVIDRIANATNRPIDGARRSFSDVPAGYVHRDAIERLAGAGVITGYANGTFDPGAPVTREQLASLLVRFIESSTGDTLTPGRPFVDQASASNVHSVNLLKARGAGIMEGDTTGRVYPRIDIRRDQAASLFIRTLGVLPIAD